MGESVEVEVRNPDGIHARPAVEFVKAASRFSAAVTLQNLTRGGAPADAKDLFAVARAAARMGHRVRIEAEGEDAAAAVATLGGLVEAGLGERLAAVGGAPVAGRETRPLSASPPVASPAAERGGGASASAALAGRSARLDVVAAGPYDLAVRAPALARVLSGVGTEVTVESPDAGRGPVPAAAVPRVVTLRVDAGGRVRFAAPGDDGERALAVVRAVAAEIGPLHSIGFRLPGTGAAPGVAIAPAWRYAPGPSGAEGGGAAPGGAPATGAVDAAAAAAAAQLAGLATRVRADGREEEAGIFDFQAMVATNPALLADARGRVEAGVSPVEAIRGAAETVAAGWADSQDEILAARGADLRDVAERIARVLTGSVLALPAEPAIAVAEDLPPSVTAEIPPGLLLGIAMEGGSRTAHAAILARGLGIPCVVGARGLLAAVEAAAGGAPPGAMPGPGGAQAAAVVAPVIGIDGGSGVVTVNPTEDEVAALREAEAAAGERAARATALLGRRGALADGEPVMLAANIGGPDDAARAIEAGAEGVGLFRTEFVFMRRPSAPTEEEQVVAYRRVFEAFGPDRPVVVRLADIGGDKDIPYLGLPAEANPFLGVRAIRLAYRSRDLLVTQLRAISRAAALAGVTPHVMAPMVATLADVDLLDSLREEAQAGLATDGAPRADRIVTGIMVEIPSAALLAAELARRVGFFSIGTNDLTQYTMAADRGNATLGPLQDALHPAVLRLIAQVVAGADAAGIPVAVCGELAADPAGALVLAGLGVDELSADAGALGEVRLALAACTRADLDALARAALAAADAAAVRDLVAGLLARRS
ncbi:MAG: phosphoenolpyruvate--protein phosphotransferase [Chloroflexi bacterium]|nr:phosphoenolpyruvate--protein phosphotransferase [Chloroflexota bacterium]